MSEPSRKQATNHETAAVGIAFGLTRRCVFECSVPGARLSIVAAKISIKESAISTKHVMLPCFVASKNFAGQSLPTCHSPTPHSEFRMDRLVPGLLRGRLRCQAGHDLTLYP